MFSVDDEQRGAVGVAVLQQPPGAADRGCV